MFLPGKGRTKKSFWRLFYLFAVTTIAYLIFNVPVLNFISVVICAFIMICILYGGKISKAVLVTVLTIGMMAVSEALVAICIGAVGVNPVQQNPYYDSIFVTILLPVIQYLIVMIVRNFVSLKNDEVMPKSYWIVTVSLPFLVTVFIIILYTKSSLPAAFLVICGILFISD